MVPWLEAYTCPDGEATTTDEARTSGGKRSKGKSKKRANPSQVAEEAVVGRGSVDALLGVRRRVVVRVRRHHGAAVQVGRQHERVAHDPRHHGQRFRFASLHLAAQWKRVLHLVVRGTRESNRYQILVGGQGTRV